MTAPAFWLEVVVLGVVLAIATPGLVVVVECLLALLPGSGACHLAKAEERPSTAVLVPAHDEEAGISSCVAAVRAQLGPEDRVLVGADNCSDRTAERAREAGAEVVERRDHERRGKGYALQFGVDHLAAAPPAVLVVLDADCCPHSGALETIARHAAALGRPVQCENLLRPQPDAGPRVAVSVLAFLVKNAVRVRGLSRVRLPCQLTGTGMAFPWELVAARDLGEGHIVEDMLLGVELALEGYPAAACAEGLIESDPPRRDEGALTQRTRWEHGHLQMLFLQAPRLLGAGLRRGRIDLLALAADLAVPPLSLLILGWGAVTLLAAGSALVPGVSWLPLVVSGGGLLVLALTLLAAWARFGRKLLPFRALAAVPAYVLWKVPVYLAFALRGPPGEWVRTERAKGPESAGAG